MCLGTLLVVNPLPIFLLTGNAWLSLGTPATAIAAMLYVFRRGWSLASAYLFNALALGSVFVHGEVLLVYGFPHLVTENLYEIKDGYYFNRPFLDQTFSGTEFSTRYRTNAQGFRIADSHDAMQTYTEADWLVIGDSFTQGAQVNYPELYTTILNRRFPDKIVVNAGISGVGIGHEYHYYVRDGDRLGPSLVILQLSSFNDFMNVEPRAARFSDRLMAHSALVRRLLEPFKFTDTAALPLGRWTEPFQQQQDANADFNVFYKRASPVKERDLEAFRDYLRRFRDAVAERGARLVVVLLPTKEQVHPFYLEEVLHAYQMSRDELDMTRPNDMLRQLVGDLQIGFVDLLEPFQKSTEDPFLVSDEHLSPHGHLVLAESLATYLMESGERTQVRALTEGLSPERYPMFSQDGMLLTYQAVVNGSMELFVSTPDLQRQRRLTFNAVDEAHPMLSKDNSQVVFTAGSAASQQTDVVIMSIDGSRRRLLTPEHDVFSAIPSLSPSNLHIAYAEWRRANGQLTNAQIVVLDVVTGQKRYITDGTEESWRPVFSPDGRFVFYICKRSEQFDVCAFDLHTGVEKRLTNTPYDEWDPQVSPDGSRIVYAARANGNWDLFILHMGTGENRQLTHSRGDEWDPSFAPDGMSIVFAGKYGPREALLSMPLPH
jgi:Tol biopolymer transport system component